MVCWAIETPPASVTQISPPSNVIGRATSGAPLAASNPSKSPWFPDRVDDAVGDRDRVILGAVRDRRDPRDPSRRDVEGVEDPRIRNDVDMLAIVRGTRRIAGGRRRDRAECRNPCRLHRVGVHGMEHTRLLQITDHQIAGLRPPRRRRGTEVDVELRAGDAELAARVVADLFAELVAEHLPVEARHVLVHVALIRVHDRAEAVALGPQVGLDDRVVVAMFAPLRVRIRRAVERVPGLDIDDRRGPLPSTRIPLIEVVRRDRRLRVQDRTGLRIEDRIAGARVGDPVAAVGDDELHPVVDDRARISRRRFPERDRCAFVDDLAGIRVERDPDDASRLHLRTVTLRHVRVHATVRHGQRRRLRLVRIARRGRRLPYDRARFQIERGDRPFAFAGHVHATPRDDRRRDPRVHRAPALPRQLESANGRWRDPILRWLTAGPREILPVHRPIPSGTRRVRTQRSSVRHRRRDERGGEHDAHRQREPTHDRNPVLRVARPSTRW